MRLATALGQTLDQLLIEKVGPEKLRELNVSGDISDHWNKSLELFNILLERWPRELAARALIDLAERRNRLLAYLAERWRSRSEQLRVGKEGFSTGKYGWSP